MFVVLSSCERYNAPLPTWSKWVTVSRRLCFRFWDVVELGQSSVLPPDLVEVVQRLHRLVNVAR